MMKILVYGHKGWIGTQFCQLVSNIEDCTVIKASSSPGKDNDIKVIEELNLYQPTHVALFIGRTNGPGCSTIDYIEDKLDLNVRDNLYAPVLMALLCKEKNIHLTYIGTGCIFQYDEEHEIGSEGKLFIEEDVPNFFGSGYSVVKGFTDRLMHNFNENVLNLRIRMPISYDDNPRNFITKISTYNKVVNVPNSITVLPQLLPKVIELMKIKTVGTINLVQPDPISHNEILQLYKEIVDNSFTWENFTIEEQNVILKAKRSNCALDTSKLKNLFPDVLNARESVIIALQHIANKNPEGVFSDSL